MALPPSSSRIDPDEVFRSLVFRTASDVGQSFFESLVRSLAGALRMTGAWVTEYIEDERKLRTLAFWMRGQHVPSFDYAIAGTPCETVVCERRFSLVDNRVAELFPQDPALLDWGAASYLGFPLLDDEDRVLGHLGAFDAAPIDPQPALEPIFAAFAARASAELQRTRAAEQLQAREALLSGLVETAMDAILLLDETGMIVRLNPAALRVFDCTEEDLLGERFSDFLDAASARQFALFLDRVADVDTGDGKLWVPQHLQALRWDRSPFPVEITLSRFPTGTALNFTVILRNIDERLEAERRIRELTAEAEFLRAEHRDVLGPAEMIGRSPCMRSLFDAIERVAPLDSTVLIHGETGTGKELVARAVHQRSRRAEGPLVKVNCAAIPATLMESEFFGHEKGAFTGATARREGRFAQADGGTLFLDELGELSLELQAKLLRVIQEGEFERVGGTGTIKVDVRIVAATNRDLAALVQEGRFREDLFYRLNVFPIQLPPLRERRDDIVLLAQAFLDRLACRMGRAVAPFDEENLRVLQAYDWPGNVRELQNVIERAVILAHGSRVDVTPALPGRAAAVSAADALTAVGIAGATPPRILTARELREMEGQNLRRAMDATGWKVSGPGGAAALLGLPASTVASRLKAFGIRPGPVSEH